MASTVAFPIGSYIKSHLEFLNCSATFFQFSLITFLRDICFEENGKTAQNTQTCKKWFVQ